MPTLCEIEHNSGISVLRRAAARIASVSQIEPLSVNTRHAQTLSGAAGARAYQHLSASAQLTICGTTLCIVRAYSVAGVI